MSTEAAARPTSVLVRVPGIATITCPHGRTAEVQVRLRDGQAVVESPPLCLACGPVRYRWTRSRRRIRLLVGPEEGDDAQGASRTRRRAGRSDG
ncbi:hypothetical protein HRbin24_00112 [bacterium HR24]|nr:hypothetical protein HRbin24_00112 [bacterium HR24]